MTSAADCSQNRDELRLVREGTSQDQRLSPALDPAYAPADERGVANDMVFAQAYSAFLQYYDAGNAPAGDWKPFFSGDLSVQLAVAAVQDVEYYKSNQKEFFDFVNNQQNQSHEQQLKERLGYLFSLVGTLAQRLDALQQGLPAEISLKGMLQNLIASQLAPAFQRLLAYYKADDAVVPITDRLVADAQPGLIIMGSTTVVFKDLYHAGLSGTWITDSSADWQSYLAGIAADASVFGSGATVFERINHIATHNLFTSIFDQFLKAYARTVAAANLALQASFTDWDRHEPHYALFLAFLRLFVYARAELNTLTGRHLDFYYREVLRLKEKAAQPGHAHLLVALANQAQSRDFPAGELFQAGKDDLGSDAFFANDRDFVANQALVASLSTLYRHKNGPNETLPHQDGRLFASPVANSDDGPGADLTSVDQSWQPFYNKIYRDGALSAIDMPKAEVGFAIASHHLLLAEGSRVVVLEFSVGNVQQLQALTDDYKDGVVCQFTGEKGWIQKPAVVFATDGDLLLLAVALTGADPAVVPYAADLHGYDLQTDLPVLMVKLQQQDTADYLYPLLQDLEISGIDLTVYVQHLKTLAVSNDFGPVDSSKPFQPFGAQPVANSSLVVGSREAFQKTLSGATLNVQWQATPAPYGGKIVQVNTDYLQAGIWQQSGLDASDIQSSYFPLIDGGGAEPYLDAPDLSSQEFFATSSRSGFVRLRLSGDFGQSDFEQALIDYIKRVTDSDPNNDGSKPLPPVAPSIGELSLDYTARQTIALDSADQAQFDGRAALFLHVAPFGSAEQHPYLKIKDDIADKAVYLLPQFKHVNVLDPKLPKGAPVEHEAEFLLGVSGLIPPQNLALLFEVADGTADPLSEKPVPHLHWSYLRDNEWIAFAKNDVDDLTGELLDSGIVTFAMPRDASAANTLFPGGQHWIRGAVASQSDAVCRLRLVAAQALQATFADKGNDPAFPAKVLPPGTINKLDQPDADVKSVSQPFESFGGRGQEAPGAFYTRVSERLRHKDRAIGLWDYERLLLEAFPQIYKAKCLNHTQYEPNESGTGVYRELAPGHVTIVTIPDQQFHNLRDPFRPYTSLGLLAQIGTFLGQRLSCFAQLHVKNPQFEEIKADFKVRLYPGFDESFYLARLNESVIRFLSPWAFPGGGTPSFGGKVYKSVLINFAEEQPYVDYVTDFKLFHTFQDLNDVQQTEEGDEVQGSKAISILVSARNHVIAALNPAEVQTVGENCPCAA